MGRVKINIKNICESTKYNIITMAFENGLSVTTSKGETVKQSI